MRNGIEQTRSVLPVISLAFGIQENTRRETHQEQSSRGLVTKRIVYRDRRRPHDRPQELKIDVRRSEIVDAGYAAAMVAVRTSIPLTNVTIVEIAGLDQ